MFFALWLASGIRKGQFSYKHSRGGARGGLGELQPAVGGI